MATKDNNTLIAVGGIAVVFGAAWWNHNRITNAKSNKIVPVDTSDVESEFALSTDQLRQLIQNFHSEMEKGLAVPASDPSQKSCLKMIPGHIGKPSGQEKGLFYALDLGGTNFRVIQLSLEGNGTVGKQVKGVYTIGPDAMRGTSDQLFDFIADCLKDFLDKNSTSSQKAPLGFTFSFPADQQGINKGTLIKWTKGFTTSGVEGRDVVELLNASLSKKNINIEVVALANDTVGTMVTRCYEDPKCEVGVILGTGTNACYIENLSNIKKYDGAAPKGSGGMIINMEWGAFGDSKTFVPLTKYDKNLDVNSLNPSFQIFEKMISGMYLGEIARYALLEMQSKGKLFVGANVPSLTQAYTFQSAWMTDIENDNTPNLAKIEELLRSTLKIEKSTLQERKALQRVCYAVARRAARLSAAAVAAVLSKINRLQDSTVAIDGSVFEHYPHFPVMMSNTIKELYPDSSVRLVLTKDGSGNGAAIIAATVV